MSHFLKGISADKFNEKYPVGSHFVYFPVKGIPDGVEVVTRTPAWALGHGAVVVSVEGRAGGLCIEHLKPITDSVLRSESTPEDVVAMMGMAAGRRINQEDHSQPVAWRHNDGPFAGVAITRSENVANDWIARGWDVSALYTDKYVNELRQALKEKDGKK